MKKINLLPVVLFFISMVISHENNINKLMNTKQFVWNLHD